MTVSVGGTANHAAPGSLVGKEGMARKLKGGVRSVERLMAGRKIPYIKLGGKVLFDVQQVMDHIRKHHTVMPLS